MFRKFRRTFRRFKRRYNVSARQVEVKATEAWLENTDGTNTTIAAGAGLYVACIAPCMWASTGEAHLPAPIGNPNTAAVAGAHTTPLCYHLNGVKAGTASWERLGRRVCWKSLRIWGKVRINDVTQTSCVRIALIWDKQPNSGALPTYGAIFLSASNFPAQPGLMDGMNLNFRERFSVLKEWFFTVSAQGGDKTCVPFRKYIKLTGKETIFSADTSDNTSISSGALYIVAASDGTKDVYGESPFLLFRSRVRYTDA